MLGELRALGATDARERGAQIHFGGDLRLAYRVCLESRVASRVYLELLQVSAEDEAAMYRALRSIDWSQHLAPGATLACEFSGRHPQIVNTHFGALRIKDAIVDALRESTGVRPDIATARPDVRVQVHARGILLTVSLDLAGEGLHRRGWRAQAVEAPLRENLAAGILLRAGWPAIAAAGGGLLDPLCGSGTFVIEAARIAADIAANLGREYFGFVGWRGHDAAAWSEVQAAARQRAAAGLAARRESAPLRGLDRDARAVAVARENARAADVAALTEFGVAQLDSAAPTTERGLLVANPPYGVRLGDREAARAVHAELGRVLRERFVGWQAAILTGAPEMGLELGLRASRTHVIWNGAIEARLLRFDIEAGAARDLRPRRDGGIDLARADSAGAQMFANRIAKNLRTLKSWLRRESIGCYRLYDADMPEYAFAIDHYTAADDSQRWLVVQEYAAPADIPEQDVRRRRSEALAALSVATAVPPDHLHIKVRRRRARGEQYERSEGQGQFHVVLEAGLKFLVNFEDYLDTGLFLDHRITRAHVRAAAQGADMLNLFGYTGSASVYAAAGGARSTLTVDLSNTYLDWAQRNLALNGFAPPAHRCERADAREWLAHAAGRGPHFDLIFLDPPTFSNSARMDSDFDIQRDHATLIGAAMAVLRPAGLLLFSTNAQRFELGATVADEFAVVDTSRATLPPDFARNPRIHRSFELRHRAGRISVGGSGTPPRPVH